MSTETDQNATLTLRSRFNVKLRLKEGEGGTERVGIGGVEWAG